MELSDPLDVSINVTYVIISFWIPFRWFPFEKKQVIFQVHLPLVSFPGCINTRWFGEDSHFDDHMFQRGWFNHQLEHVGWLGSFLKSLTLQGALNSSFLRRPDPAESAVRSARHVWKRFAKHCLPGNSANVTFLGWLRVPLSATASTSVLNQSCLYLLGI